MGEISDRSLLIAKDLANKLGPFEEKTLYQKLAEPIQYRRLDQEKQGGYV